MEVEASGPETRINGWLDEKRKYESKLAKLKFEEAAGSVIPVDAVDALFSAVIDPLSKALTVIQRRDEDSYDILRTALAESAKIFKERCEST